MQQGAPREFHGLQVSNRIEKHACHCDLVDWPATQRDGSAVLGCGMQAAQSGVGRATIGP